MNEANAFYEDMRSKHQASATRNGTDGPDESPSGSGKEDLKATQQTSENQDGSRSPTQKTLNLTPNG
jgi:autophagy-related protein 16